MRFVIAMMRHETNTFSPLPTPLSSFGRTGGHDGEPFYGDEVVEAYAGTNNPIAAYLDLAREVGAEVVTPVAGEACPSPAGRSRTMPSRLIANTICDSVVVGCDALFLDLHGAMVTGLYDDPEGRLLKRVRTVAPDLPIAVAFDFHANLSAETIENATIITGYRTYPHVDMYDAGLRAGRTLLRSLDGEITPVMAWGSLPLLTHMLRQTPARQPMKDVMDMAIAAEAEGKVLNASVFGGFPLADHPHVGVSTVVVGDGDAGAAVQLSEALLAMTWERRADFVYPVEPAEDSIARAKALDGGPVVLVEHGDNCGAGGNQDVMAAVEEVMRQGLEDVAVSPVWDPGAVAEIIDAGVGNRDRARPRRQDRHAGDQPRGAAAAGCRSCPGHHRRPLHGHGPDDDGHADQPRSDGRAGLWRRRDHGVRGAHGTVRPRRLSPRGHRADPKEVSADQVAPAFPGRLRTDRQAHRRGRGARSLQLRLRPVPLRETAPPDLSTRPRRDTVRRSFRGKAGRSSVSPAPPAAPRAGPPDRRRRAPA